MNPRIQQMSHHRRNLTEVHITPIDDIGEDLMYGPYADVRPRQTFVDGPPVVKKKVREENQSYTLSLPKNKVQLKIQYFGGKP